LQADMLIVAGCVETLETSAVSLGEFGPAPRFTAAVLGKTIRMLDATCPAIYAGVQFPLDAYEQFMKQGVPRWVTTDDQIIAAYIELIDKVCPCVLLVHSQGAAFAFKAAEARPDKIKAMVVAEPSGTGNKDKVAVLKNIPIAVIYGDNAKEHPRWGRIRQNVSGYADAIRQAGGSVDLIDLPDIGIKGNTHMLMMDKNSDAVAEVIQKWFVAKGFVD
jgi:hypothetical protein